VDPGNEPKIAKHTLDVGFRRISKRTGWRYHSISYKGSFLPTHLFAHLFIESQVLYKSKQINVKTNILSNRRKGLEPRSQSKKRGSKLQSWLVRPKGHN